MSYTKDRHWSDQFIPDIKAKVGPLLVTESSYEVDTKQAADLIVLDAKNIMIAARVRRHGYTDKYPFDFTVRSHRDSGAKTELRKMLEGFGDWMFYGHASKKGPTVDKWMVVDLDVWRLGLHEVGYRRGWHHLATQKDNGDGTSFLAFDVRNFPENLVIGGNIEIPRKQDAA